MKGIKFGDYHSYNDFHLLLESKEIGSPEIKTNEVEVEGSSSVIDYTEYFGEVKYGKRQLAFNFNTIVPQSQFMDLFSQIQNAIHGQKLKIVLDADSDYYYYGRIEVSAFTNDRNIGIISITCDCEPWKFKAKETVVTTTVSGTQTVNLGNSRKRVVPIVTSTASMTITYNGTTTSIGTGAYTIPTLELKEGNNAVTISGTGTITFSYREGGL